MKLPDEDKLKRRVMDILAEWEQLVLNDFCGGRWARTSPDWHDFSLVYISKSKFNGERFESVQTMASPNASFLNSYRIANVTRCGTVYCIRFKAFF